MTAKLLVGICSLSLLLATACDNAPTTPKPVDITINRNAASALAGDAMPNHPATISRKWTTGTDTYLNLKLDGTFEGTLDANSLSVGKWTISDDGKTLTLTAEQSTEGKGNSAPIIYTVISISEHILKVIDAAGKEIEFTAQ